MSKRAVGMVDPLPGREWLGTGWGRRGIRATIRSGAKAGCNRGGE
jgi:hypothetical protein